MRCVLLYSFMVNNIQVKISIEKFLLCMHQKFYAKELYMIGLVGKWSLNKHAWWRKEWPSVVNICHACFVRTQSKYPNVQLTLEYYLPYNSIHFIFCGVFIAGVILPRYIKSISWHTTTLLLRLEANWFSVLVCTRVLSLSV